MSFVLQEGGGDNFIGTCEAHEYSDSTVEMSLRKLMILYSLKGLVNKAGGAHVEWERAITNSCAFADCSEHSGGKYWYVIV